MRGLLILLIYIIFDTTCKKNVKFRTEKVNFIWSKAAVQLTDQPAKLEKLMGDLSKFDDAYLNLKQDLHHTKSTSIKNIELIDQKLESILDRYDLNDVIYSLRMKYKYGVDDVQSSRSNSSKTKRYNFEDSRVRTLWDSVKDDKSFTLMELDDLYYDLREHDAKVQEYNGMLKQLADWEKQHNHVATEHHEDMNEEHKNFVNIAKRMNIELENNMNEFEARVERIKANPFKQAKVRFLWEKAIKKAGLMPNELDVIKTELRHLERHLEKMDYHQAQARELHEFERGNGKLDVADNSKGGLSQNLREQHEKILKKIKKLEYYLNDKLSSGETKHSEL